MELSNGIMIAKFLHRAVVVGLVVYHGEPHHQNCREVCQKSECKNAMPFALLAASAAKSLALLRESGLVNAVLR